MTLKRKLFGGFVAGMVGLMLSACGGAPTDEEQENPGATQEAPIIIGHKEVSTVFYSDDTYKVQVGWRVVLCNYTVTMEGTTSPYYKEIGYACGGAP